MNNTHRIDRGVSVMADAPAGFTLIGIMATVAIVVILLAVAVPSVRDIMIRSRVDAETAGLVADLTFARTEAVRRGVAVVVCPADEAAARCAGSNWNAPRIVFVDSEGDPLELDPADTLLRLSEAPSSQITMTPSSPVHGVRFQPNGTASGVVTVANALDDQPASSD